MSELTPVVSAQHGAFFLAQPVGRTAEMITEDDDESDTVLRLIGSYGYQRRSMPTTFRPGESLVGQAAVEKRPISLTEAPPGTCGSPPASARPTRPTWWCSRCSSRAGCSV